MSNFHEKTFVAFLDISGFKEMMKEDDNKAINALDTLYQAGYDTLIPDKVEGFFISDCGILFARGADTNSENTISQRLKEILDAIKTINLKMLGKGYMLTTSVSYGDFDYASKLEFPGISKSPIYGNAYVQAYFDQEKGKPRIQPGECRIVMEHFPSNDITLDDSDFNLLRQKGKHLYFYWNLRSAVEIDDFERRYKNSKYSGMLAVLRESM